MNALAYLIRSSALTLALGGAALSQETVWIAAEGSYPQWNATDADGKLIGFDIDVGNSICERMGMSCEWVSQQWDGIIIGLLSGHYDMIISSISITDERRRSIAFSNGYVADPVFFVAADSNLQAAQTLGQAQTMLVGKRSVFSPRLYLLTSCSNIWATRSKYAFTTPRTRSFGSRVRSD